MEKWFIRPKQPQPCFLLFTKRTMPRRAKQTSTENIFNGGNKEVANA
jgi:hypothetical protein